MVCSSSSLKIKGTVEVSVRRPEYSVDVRFWKQAMVLLKGKCFVGRESPDLDGCRYKVIGRLDHSFYFNFSK